MRNISNKRAATRSAIEPEAELVMVTDRDGLIEFVNRGFEEAYGYAGPEIIGRNPSFLKSGQHSDATYRHLWKTILKGEVYRGELVNHRKDGRLFRESKAIFPLTDGRGAIVRFVAVGSDVTERSEPQGRFGDVSDLGVVLDVSGKRSTEQEIYASEDVGNTSSAELLSVLEKERKRLASELHDDIGQILTGVKMRVESAISSISKGDFVTGQRGLVEVVPIIREAMDEVRRISLDLRPPMIDDLGVVATIGWFCREFPLIRGGLRVELDLRIDESDIPERLKIVIFRVLQEAMNNIAKHADAQVARVRLLRSLGTIEFVIEDNGCGFDIAQAKRRGSGGHGLGLANMRERVEATGGRLSLETIRGAGTIIRAIFPCAP